MASTKKKGERSKVAEAGRAVPAVVEGGARSKVPKVAAAKSPVKKGKSASAVQRSRPRRSTAAEKRRSAAAKKAAETRKREAEYRARVAHERAKEQRARALADKRRAKKELAARVETEKAAAAQALLEATERARVVAESKEATDREIYRAQLAVQQAQLEERIVERVAELESIVEIRTGREMLEEQIAKYYERAKEEGKIKPISDRHASGKSWRHESRVRSGGVVDRKVGRFLTEESLESMARRLVKAAIKAKGMEPRGKLYVSFSIVEYGRNVPKSPGPAFYQDALGSFWQAYEGTANLSPAADIAGFEEQIRSILEMRLRSSGSGNAILIDTFEVKSYYERTEEEQREFVTERRRERREREAAARAKAEK